MIGAIRPLSSWFAPLDGEYSHGWALTTKENICAFLQKGLQKGLRTNFSGYLEVVDESITCLFNRSKEYSKVRITGLSTILGEKRISLFKKTIATIRIVAFNAFQWLLEFFRSSYPSGDVELTLIDNSSKEHYQNHSDWWKFWLRPSDEEL